MLPNQELDLSPDIEPAELRANDTPTDEYLLQIGSFRQEGDADRRRGGVALPQWPRQSLVALTNG